MIELRFKGVERSIQAVPGEITNLVIEVPSMLYRILKGLFLEDDDQLIVSKNSDLISPSKEVLFIKSLFDLNPNSKKVLTMIYKQASKAYINDERKKAIDNINREISDLLDDISSEFNYPMTFEREFGIDKIMQASSFSFSCVESVVFLNDFLSYLRAIQEISQCHYIITFDLFSVLETEKVSDLQNELSLMGLTLINLASSCKNESSLIKNTIVIDSDYCEI